MDQLAECYYCKKAPTHPLSLLCQHSYCQDCLTNEIQNDKIICPVCGTEHITPAASLSSAKADTLAPYLVGVHSGASYVMITDDSPPTMQAECAGCKKTTDLRKCFHCEKALCVDCRTKHCEIQKKDVDQSTHNLETKIGELITLAQALNTSRAARIEEYKTMKVQISVHAKDLIKKIQDEEQDLLKKLDARSHFESEKIDVTKRELEYLKKNKAALDQLTDKYREESNQMVLLKMQTDYLETVPAWKAKIESQSGRLNAKKEEELHFHPTVPKKDDALVGTLKDSKNVSIHAPSDAKRMAAHNDDKKSKTCTIM